MLRLPRLGRIDTPTDDLDLLWSVEMEAGDEFEQRYQYLDGHIETGRTRYTGNKVPFRVSPFEFRYLPELEALTPLTTGAVKIL